jgi:hypothetical protein
MAGYDGGGYFGGRGAAVPAGEGVVGPGTLYSSADLLQRYIDMAQRPTTESASADFRALAFRLMTEAQSEWITHFAAIVPDVVRSSPLKMESTDGGYTYEFRDSLGNGVFPIGHVEIRASRTGPVLTPCSDTAVMGDYVPEGYRIRIPNGQMRTFTEGPYARAVLPPGPITEDVEPTLQPPFARVLIVYRALSKWARRGGMRDPQPFLDMENEAWYGNPNAGVTGILGALRTQHAYAGMAMPTDPAAWWRGNPDLGRTWGL